jgi:hypothetical protein
MHQSLGLIFSEKFKILDLNVHVHIFSKHLPATKAAWVFNFI